MIVGHEAVRAELERELPPVTLIIGPDSVGKTTLAMHAARRHSSFTVHHERLSAADARLVVGSASVRHRQVSVYVISLDGSTEAAQNILLKVLEEPPPHCRFILLASRAPLLTIASRARVYRLGLLSDEQVARVLRANGVAEVASVSAAARARGRVAPALAAAGDRESSRITSVVAAAVRAAAEGGGTTVELALRNWTPEHTRVLEQWATEKANGRWVHFTDDLAPAVTREGAMRLLYVLSTYDARTAPAVALGSLKEKKR